VRVNVLPRVQNRSIGLPNQYVRRSTVSNCGDLAGEGGIAMVHGKGVETVIFFSGERWLQWHGDGVERWYRGGHWGTLSDVLVRTGIRGGGRAHSVYLGSEFAR
jgi:hypothetical protein